MVGPCGVAMGVKGVGEEAAGAGTALRDTVQFRGETRSQRAQQTFGELREDRQKRFCLIYDRERKKANPA